MPNYFYFDPTGNRQGPVNDQQLQALASQRIITPETPLETEGGHKGKAGQIPGLDFPAATAPKTPSFDFSTPKPGSKAKPTKPKINAGSIKSWLLDFAFRDIRLPLVNLWACRIVYAICLIAALLALVFGTLGVLYGAFENITHGDFIVGVCFGIFGTLGIWIGSILSIFAVRLILEWYIIFDWIVETTKAARIYVENNRE